MGKTLTIKKVAHHRNGVCGDPFDVGIIDDHMSEDDGESVYLFEGDSYDSDADPEIELWEEIEDDEE